MFALGPGEILILLLIFGVIPPFIINAKLAKRRGKSVALMLLLTCIFSWIVTLILAFLPDKEEVKSK